MSYLAEDRRSRALAIGLTAAIEIAAVMALLSGLAARGTIHSESTFTALSLPAPRPSPSPTPPPPHRAAHKPPGKAAPPGRHAKAAPVYAPKLERPPPPIPVATNPANGDLARSGASDRNGPGSGAGGAGNGTGAGGAGDGEGDGGSDAEWTGGKIKDADYPRDAREAGAQGTTSVRIAVSVAGRATGCRVAHSSGNAELDATTCRLILQRFRFNPARDAGGKPIEGTVEYDQEWVATGQW